jgi:RNA polymerase sigma-70 factor (ECF subfamily)
LWDELYRACRDELTHYCFSLCHSEAEAQDLAQDTFFRALQNEALLATFSQPQRRAWLYKTAHNLFCDRARRTAREERLLTGLCRPEELDFSGGAAFNNVELNQLLLRLPETDRALFYLRYAEGYNATELGELFALPPSTVRARLSRARQQLQLYLMED